MKSLKIANCPNSPNCVSSLAEDSGHYIEPIRYAGPGKAAFEKLKKTLELLPDTQIVAVDENYVHVEFRSKYLRFVDDVKAQLNDNEKRIEIRSASRVGYSDFGANRKRVELIRKKFNQ